MSGPERDCCAVRPLYARNTQQAAPSAQQGTQQTRNSQPPGPSLLELARNLTRNSNATRPERARNNQPKSDPDLLRDVAQGTRGIAHLVTCRTCRHFAPNPYNPAEGMGACEIDQASDRPPWPDAPRRCAHHHPTRTAVFDAAAKACAGLEVDPSALTQWLLDQGDPGWLTPPAVAWWARYISAAGYPEGARHE